MPAVVLFPFQIKRQFAAPIDPDTVFTTTSSRNAYLTNPRRYAGMIVVDLEADNAYRLNGTADAWILLTGGGGGGSTGNMIEFTPGDVSFPAVGATTYVSSSLVNAKVLVVRNGVVQRGTDPGDGNTYITKVIGSNTLTFSHALLSTDYIQIITIIP